jgi:NADPH:quinone reductase-like Zn-dependent oxidoreductase
MKDFPKTSGSVLRTTVQMQDTPYFELQYPFIFGTDVAGTVVQLGSKVTRFKIGERVIGYGP